MYTLHLVYSAPDFPFADVLCASGGNQTIPVSGSCFSPLSRTESIYRPNRGLVAGLLTRGKPTWARIRGRDLRRRLRQRCGMAVRRRPYGLFVFTNEGRRWPAASTSERPTRVAGGTGGTGWAALVRAERDKRDALGAPFAVRLRNGSGCNRSRAALLPTTERPRPGGWPKVGFHEEGSLARQLPDGSTVMGRPWFVRPGWRAITERAPESGPLEGREV